MCSGSVISFLWFVFLLNILFEERFQLKKLYNCKFEYYWHTLLFSPLENCIFLQKVFRRAHIIQFIFKVAIPWYTGAYSVQWEQYSMVTPSCFGKTEWELYWTLVALQGGPLWGVGGRWGKVLHTFQWVEVWETEGLQDTSGVGGRGR